MLRSTLATLGKKARTSCLVTTRSASEKALVPELDWSEISKVVHTDEGKKELASLRKAYDEIMSFIRSDPGSVEPINWEMYQKGSADPSIVEMFKQAYTNLKIPKIDDSLLKEFESEFAVLQKEAQKAKAEAEVRLKEIEGEIQGIDAAIARLSTATIEEELDANPVLARQIDKEISEHKW